MEQIVTESINEINNLTKARAPLIYLVSHDETKCIKEIYRNLCVDTKLEETKNLWVWSSAVGLAKYDNNFFKKPPENTAEDSMNPAKMLNHITNDQLIDKPSIYILKDFNYFLTPSIARQLKDMYNYLENSSHRKTVIMMGTSVSHFHGTIKPGIEPTLEKQLHIVHWELPTRRQIEDFLKSQIDKAGKKNIAMSKFSNQDIYEISRALQGLNFVEVCSAINLCLAEKKTLDPKRLMAEKKQIILRSDILEYIESNYSMSDIGGLDNLKDYIKSHAGSNSEEAVEFGVDPLKGIILVGIPGAGKSLSAKAIGNEWGIPTLRLDVGKVMHGLVGGSEQRMREVTTQAKAVAPCVLWVDEIEKALSGTKSSNFSDGGTLSRVFGTLLTAMEEEFNQAGIVLVATANDISMLPPELVRRFSDTFYVGLPTFEERKEIFAIHLSKKKRDPKKFNLDTLANASNKFTGAEIEKALREAISICFNSNKKEVTTEDVLIALKSTKPLYTVMGPRIREIEDWAKDRARFASSLCEKEVKEPGVTTSTGTKISMKNLDSPDDEEILPALDNKITN